MRIIYNKSYTMENISRPRRLNSRLKYTMHYLSKMQIGILRLMRKRILEKNGDIKGERIFWVIKHPLLVLNPKSPQVILLYRNLLRPLEMFPRHYFT